MPWHLPWVTFRTSQSTVMGKGTGDRMHPCLTPVSIMEGPVTWLLCMTRHSRFSYKGWMMFSNFCGIRWCRRIFQSDGRCRLSRTLSKSTNTTYKEVFHSNDCSIILRRTKMWSINDSAFLKPAFSWRSSLFTAIVLRLRMMQQKNLLLMDSNNHNNNSGYS